MVRKIALFSWMLSWMLWAGDPVCRARFEVYCDLTKMPLMQEDLKVFNQTLQAKSQFEENFTLPLRLNEKNQILATKYGYQPTTQQFTFKECPTKPLVIYMKPLARELGEVAVIGYDAKTLLYKLMQPELISENIRAVANYVDVKKYDPYQMPESTLEKIASPISTLFALSNKKSRQMRRIQKYRSQTPSANQVDSLTTQLLDTTVNTPPTP